ncbi:MAG: response regulator [Burkholderiales bacterium]|nr:response regulator [Burkholderiales bacterium]
MLVVDDNPLNLEIAQVLLVDAGFAVHTATSAAAARLAWQDGPPDLVLLDIQMPEVDGLSLARELRRLPGGARARLVAFTAYAMKGDRERCLAAGLDGYLTKPIEAAYFADQVRALLPPDVPA